MKIATILCAVIVGFWVGIPPLASAIDTWLGHINGVYQKMPKR